MSAGKRKYTLSSIVVRLGSSRICRWSRLSPVFQPKPRQRRHSSSSSYTTTTFCSVVETPSSNTDSGIRSPCALLGFERIDGASVLEIGSDLMSDFLDGEGGTPRTGHPDLRPRSGNINNARNAYETPS